jgi:microcystin-dependent protein
VDRRVLTRNIDSDHEVGKVGTDQVQLYSKDGKLYAQLSSNDAVLVADLSIGNDATPVGAVNAFAGSDTAPAGWLLCDGGAVTNGSSTVQGQTADFSDLYALLGTTYGSAGTLPDLAGRVIAQEDGTYARGVEGGAVGVGLVAGNVPAHNHGLTDGTAIAGSTVDDTTGEGDYGKPWVNACMSITGGGETNAHRKVSVWNGASCVEATGYASQDASNLQNFDYYFDVATALSGATDNSTGTGSAHENRQPTLYMNYIIKF